MTKVWYHWCHIRVRIISFGLNDGHYVHTCIYIYISFSFKEDQNKSNAMILILHTSYSFFNSILINVFFHFNFVYHWIYIHFSSTQIVNVISVCKVKEQTNWTLYYFLPYNDIVWSSIWFNSISLLQKTYVLKRY